MTDTDKQVGVMRAALTSRDETHYPSNAGRLAALEASSSLERTLKEQEARIVELEAENTRLREAWDRTIAEYDVADYEEFQYLRSALTKKEGGK